MFQNMRYAPFLKMYEEILKELPNISYDVVYYNRDKLLNELEDEQHIPIQWYGKGTVAAPKYEKLLNFALYKFNAKKMLEKKKYDFIIVLTTFPAVLLSNYLSKYYKGKYIVDIRDYTQESFKPYFLLEKKAFENSAMCVISSPGFVNFLPKHRYYNCHNIDAQAKNIPLENFRKAIGRRIVISYIGSISYEKQCKQLIDLVVKDDRFEFLFFGNEANGTVISEYVERLNNPRIKMMGAFMPNAKPEIYHQSDLVFNCYGNDSLLVKYAISNKYYDGALYRKPLLVSPNTAMAKMSNQFAYEMDLDNLTDLNDLFKWYFNLDQLAFERYTDTVIKRSVDENLFLQTKIKQVLSNLL